MIRWIVQFYPPPGENHSPEDFIADIPILEDQIHIKNRLRLISETEVHLWPKKWVYKVEGLYQLKSGDHRIYFVTDGSAIIIVCYACMKKSQKTKRKDIAQAHRNLRSYFESKE